MKSIKLSIAMLAVMLASILIPAGMALADSPSVDDVKVYTGYAETDDWLIVVVYNVSGTDTNSSCDIYAYPWRIQLLNGAIELTDNNLQQCGMRPASIYLNADTAAGLVWGTNYSVKIYGNFGAEPNASRTINASDWVGENLNGLDQWVISKAKIIGTFDSVDYVDAVPVYGEVLNTDGGYIFDTGIPYLSHYRPDIFEITAESVIIDYEETDGTGSYGEGLYTTPMEDIWGLPIATALDNMGFYFGIDGRIFGAVLMFIGFICLAAFSKTIAFLIIIGGVVVGLVPMSLLLVVVLVLAVVFIRGWFWSST